MQYITSTNYWDNLWRSITLSFATSPTDSFTFGKIPTGTGLGIGVHLQFAHGKPSKNVVSNLLGWFDAVYIQTILQAVAAKLRNNNNNRIEDLDAWLTNLLTFDTYKELAPDRKTDIKLFIENTLLQYI